MVKETWHRRGTCTVEGRQRSPSTDIGHAESDLSSNLRVVWLHQHSVVLIHRSCVRRQLCTDSTPFGRPALLLPGLLIPPDGYLRVLLRHRHDWRGAGECHAPPFDIPDGMEY